MSNPTVLSDAEVKEAMQCLVAEVESDGETVVIKNVNQCLRNIEQAIVMRLNGYATRYRFLRDHCGIVEYKQAFGSIGAGMLPSGEALDQAIDNAIKALGYAKTLAAKNEDSEHELQLH